MARLMKTFFQTSYVDIKNLLPDKTPVKNLVDEAVSGID